MGARLRRHRNVCSYAKLKMTKNAKEITSDNNNDNDNDGAAAADDDDNNNEPYTNS